MSHPPFSLQRENNNEKKIEQMYISKRLSFRAGSQIVLVRFNRDWFQAIAGTDYHGPE